MTNFDDLEQEFLASGMTEDSDGEPFPMGVEDRLVDGKLVPAVIEDDGTDVHPSGLIVSVDPEKRRRRRDVMDKRTGRDMERQWQQDDRAALEQAEALAAPPMITHPPCQVCQSQHRVWIERQLVKGHSYSSIANQIPDGSVSRKSIANHLDKHMQIDQTAVRRLLEEEAAAIGQNVEDGVRGAVTLRGMAETLIRKGFQDAQDGITTVEVRDMIQLMKALNELNANSGTAAIEEAKVAIQIFKEAIQNVLIKGDIIEREVGLALLEAIQEEVLKLREEQEADAMLDRHLSLPPGS